MATCGECANFVNFKMDWLSDGIPRCCAELGYDRNEPACQHFVLSSPPHSVGYQSGCHEILLEVMRAQLGAHHAGDNIQKELDYAEMDLPFDRVAFDTLVSFLTGVRSVRSLAVLLGLGPELSDLAARRWLEHSFLKTFGRLHLSSSNSPKTLDTPSSS